MSRIHPFRSRKAARFVRRSLVAIGATLLAAPVVADDYDVSFSLQGDRSAPLRLIDQTVSGSIHVFAPELTGLARVSFYLNDPLMQGSPMQVETRAPYDMGGTLRGGASGPLDTTQLPDGGHIVTSLYEFGDGSVAVDHALFNIANGTATRAAHRTLLSAGADRGNPVDLDGQSVSGDLHVFGSEAAEVQEVLFVLDDPEMTSVQQQNPLLANAVYRDPQPEGTVFVRERYAPYDFAGTVDATYAAPFPTSSLAAGEHVMRTLFKTTDGGYQAVTSRFYVGEAPTDPGTSPSPYQLLFSSTADRSGASSLEGQTVSGPLYVFTSDVSDITRVEFFIDGNPSHTEGAAPWDLVGTARDGSAMALDTSALADGAHTVTAHFTLADGSVQTASAGFSVDNGAVSVSPYQVLLSTASDRSGSVAMSGQAVTGLVYVFASDLPEVKGVDFFLDDPIMSGRAMQVENNAPYDLVGTAPGGAAMALDTTGLTDGTHVVTARFRFADGSSSVVHGAMVVANTSSGGTGGGGTGSDPGTDPVTDVSPIAHNDTTTAGTDPVVIDVLANDSGLDNAPLTVSVSSGPGNGTASVNGDLTVTYTPNAGFGGDDSFTYKVVDADGDMGIAGVSVSVDCDSGCLADKQIDVSWQPNTDSVLGYVLYRGATADTADQLVADLPVDSGIIDPKAPAVSYMARQDLGLNTGDSICFTVRAYNNVGYSDFSNAICGTM